MNDNNTTHPTAEEELEQIESNEEKLEERRERLKRGEVALPWPHSSKQELYLGILTAITGGVAFGAFLLQPAENPGLLLVSSLVLLSSGIAHILHSRWFRQHFEIDPQPRYTEPTAADGGEE